MPRIPIGEFGNLVAPPAPAARISERGREAEARGLQTFGRGLQIAGETGLEIATREQLQANRTAEIAANKAQAEQERRDAIAAQGKARVALSGFEADSIGLAGSVTAKIKAGTIQPDQAQNELTQGLDTLRDKYAGEFNQDHAPDLQSAYLVTGARAREHLNVLLGEHAREQRVANLSTTVENLTRLGEGDPRGAMQKIRSVYANEGAAILGADKAAALAQSAVEHVAFNYIAAQVEANRESSKGLKSIKLNEWGDLAPEMKNALTARINDHLAQIEAKALAYQAKRETAAKRALDDARDALFTGNDVTPKVMADTVAVSRGTPYEEAAKSLPATAAYLSQFRNAPAAQMDAAINSAQAGLKANWSRDGAERLAQLQTMRNQVVARAEKDPIGLGEAQGKIPVLLLNPLAPEFPDNLRQRIQWGDAMAQQYGVDPQYLKPEEGKAIATFLQGKTPEEQGGLLAIIAGATGDPNINRRVMAGVYKDSPAIATAGDFIAQQRASPGKSHWFSANEPPRDVGTLILKGEARINNKEVKQPKLADMEMAFASQIGTALDHNPAARKEAFDTAYRIYQGATPSYDGSLNTTAWRDAIAMAGARAVSSPGGSDVLAPYGMDEGHFRDAARAELSALNLPPNSDLINYGDGYAVKFGAGLVGNPKTGKPLVIRIMPGKPVARLPAAEPDGVVTP